MEVGYGLVGWVYWSGLYVMSLMEGCKFIK